LSTDEICEECARKGSKIYRCSKCGAMLCIHNVRTHMCASPYKKSTKSQETHSITENYWNDFKKTNKEFEIVIQDDLSFYTEFPFYPFTLLSAWMPFRRTSYKTEMKTESLNITEIFNNLKVGTDTDYERKFFYQRWPEDEFYVWLVRWKKTSHNYWTRKRVQRKTKFVLEIPQLAEDDLNILKKCGITVKWSNNAKKNLKNALDNALTITKVEVDSSDGHFRVKWSKKFNQWFHNLIDLFLDYMAIKEDEDSDTFIPSIRQIGPREIEVDYWAAFRANYYWFKINETLKTMKHPLFSLEYKPFRQRPTPWDAEVKANYELRPYQKEAIQKWQENNYFGTVQLPTGAGKTIIGMDAIRQTQERTLVLVPNLALVDQWTTQLHEKLNIDISKIGIFNGQKKEFRKHPVVISTYQLLSQYLQEFLTFTENYTKKATAKNNSLYQIIDDQDQIGTVLRREKSAVEDTVGFFNNMFGLIITDEAHHIQAETFRLIAMSLQIPKRLSLSATVEKSHHSSLVIGSMGPIVFNIGYGSLSSDGYIAPIFFERILIPLKKEEKEILKEKRHKQSVVSKMCREAHYKYETLLKLVKAPFTEQVLIYTTRVSHAKNINAFLRKNDIKATKVLTGDTVSDQDLEKVLEDFRQKKINILILVKMLNEGFDAPADTIIIVSGSRNKREQIQRVGRATRPGKVAKIFELVINPNDLEYEMEIAKERDISDVVNPYIQERLIAKDELMQFKDLVMEINLSFSKKSY
jgi:superfamily II DNA or RNA helicase